MKSIDKMNKQELTEEIERLKKQPVIVFSENGIEVHVNQAIVEKRLAQRKEHIQKLEALRDKRKI